MTHSSCTAANGCAANTAAYLVKTVAPLLESGENLYKTVSGGACFDCHGNKGTGGTNPKKSVICTYLQADACFEEDVAANTFDAIKADVEAMAANGRSRTNPKLCTDSIPAGANCSQNVSLYLKALGWKRNRQ